MARFDVYALPGGSVPLLLDVQADLLSDLKTRVVVPLILEAKAKQEVLPRLKPVFQVNGKSYIMMTTDIGTIRTKELGTHMGTLNSPGTTLLQPLIFFFRDFKLKAL